VPEHDDEALVLAALERSSAAVVVVDEDGIVRRWSAGAERVLGWAPGDALGRAWLDLGVLPDPMRRTQAAEVLQTVLAGSRWEGERVLRRRDGTSRRVHSVEEPLLGPDGRPHGAVLVTVDVSGREAFEAALLHEALHDRLTGLPGRPVLEHHLATLLAGRRSDAPATVAAVLFVDLDDFKQVNDRFGHDVGDRVLVDVARRLRGAVRGDDLVCRVGGDEFVVVARLDGREPGAREVGERVARALADDVVLRGGATVDLCASVGVATARVGDDPDELVRRADAAMYRAKAGAVEPGSEHVALG